MGIVLLSSNVVHPLSLELFDYFGGLPDLEQRHVRFIGDDHRVLYFWHSVANRMLTLLSNMFTNLNLTDMETCYKVFRREVLQGIELKSDRFGFEPEVTAKIARRRPCWRIYEVPISYNGRTYEEGKKIGLKDAFSALFCILRFRYFN